MQGHRIGHMIPFTGPRARLMQCARHDCRNWFRQLEDTAYQKRYCSRSCAAKSCNGRKKVAK